MCITIIINTLNKYFTHYDTFICVVSIFDLYIQQFENQQYLF
jgi:hypothetical protein